MKENKNITVLNVIYKTSQMGVIGINDIIDKTKQEELRVNLNKQREEYQQIMKSAEELFIEFGTEEKELGNFVKANSKMMSEAKMMTHNSDNMIAKMMMEGTSKGIIKLNKAKNENPDMDKDVKKLSEKLIKIMEHNYEELKIYL